MLSGSNSLPEIWIGDRPCSRWQLVSCTVSSERCATSVMMAKSCTLHCMHMARTKVSYHGLLVLAEDCVTVRPEVPGLKASHFLSTNVRYDSLQLQSCSHDMLNLSRDFNYQVPAFTRLLIIMTFASLPIHSRIITSSYLKADFLFSTMMLISFELCHKICPFKVLLFIILL